MKWFLGAGVYLTDGYVYTFSQDGIWSGHGVIIVGWTKDNKWIVQNSWGITWGKLGRFYIEMKDSFEGACIFHDAFGVTDNITSSDIKKPNKFIKFFGKIINFIVRLFRK